MYDQGDFLSEQVAADLVPLIIDLLDLSRLSDYESFCDLYLIPAIAQASAAISDDTVWRPLNYRILLKLRHDDPKGKFLAFFKFKFKNNFSTNCRIENN